MDVMNRKQKSKIEEVREYEIDEEEDIQDIGEEIERSLKKTSCCPDTEVCLLFPILIVATMALMLVPGFIQTDLFDAPTKYQQPMTAPMDESLPGLPRYLVPIVVALFGFYIYKIRGDMLVGALFALNFIFDQSSLGYMAQFPSVALETCLILLAHLFSHNILLVDVYSFKWFRNLLFSWILCGITLLMRPECLGSAVGLYMCCFISSLSEVLGASPNRVKMFIQSIKLLVTNYITLIPLIFGGIYIRRHTDEVAYLYKSFESESFYQELAAHEKFPFWVMIMVGLVFITKGKYRYFNVVPLIEFFVGIFATLFIPVESPGNGMNHRIFFAKLHLLLAATTVVSVVDNQLIRIAIPSLALVVSFFFKIKVIIKKIMEDTANGESIW